MENQMEVKLYEKIGKFIISVLLCVSIILSAYSIITTAKYRRTKSELEHIRTELAAVSDRKSELESELGRIDDITREATEYVSRTETLLLQSGTTITEIRKQVEDLENYCYSLEQFIYSIRDNNDYNMGEQ